MPQTATGALDFDGGHFSIVVKIEGTTYRFDADRLPPNPPFKSDSAILHYYDVDQLKGTSPFIGHVVEDDGPVLVLKIVTGPEVVAKLDKPISHQIEGVGAWSTT